MKLNALDVESIQHICSGQVITTLESAVKELVENALDAKALSIQVKMMDWGTKSFSITGTNFPKMFTSDDGSGICETDFEVFGQRHSTNKIKDFKEYFSVKTFGFRGEAVSSLCALANLSVTTCTQPPVGWRLTFDHLGMIFLILT
jgi:DNA mismatch repair protein PMS2